MSNYVQFGSLLMLNIRRLVRNLSHKCMGHMSVLIVKVSLFIFILVGLNNEKCSLSHHLDGLPVFVRGSVILSNYWRVVSRASDELFSIEKYF